ncbi:MAG: hypothetical protein M3O15_02645 [Acidobacteriota bacterium]|nr:hypothetical protein [Acidobacteriota bacterium]
MRKPTILVLTLALGAVAQGCTSNPSPRPMPSPVTAVTPSANPGAPPETAVMEAAAQPCQPDLASCPVIGCAQADTPHALANSLKRHVLQGGTPALLSFDDLHSLQSEAEQQVGSAGGELTADQRGTLAQLAVASGTASEGDLVEVSGFLVGTPHANTGESVNCSLRGVENNDFHIPINAQPQSAFASPQEAEFSSIVVEMIPQDRPAAWNLDQLKSVRDQNRRVLVVGQLFYDNLHRANGDPANPQSGQPRRFALWEIHPVTALLVCGRDDGRCDPATTGDWTPLESLNP